MVAVARMITGFLEWFHRKLFRVSAGAGTRAFFKNIGYTGLGSIGATLFLFAVNTVAVRVLGPGEYGNYILVVSVSHFMALFMGIGLEVSLMKYLPRSLHDYSVRARTSATAFWLIAAATAITGIAAYAARDYGMTLLAIPASVFLWAIAYSAILAFKEFGDGVAKGLHYFRQQAILSALYSLVIFVVFFSLFFTVERTFLIYVWAIMAGFLFYAVILIVWNGVSLRPSLVSKTIARDLAAYGLLSLLNAPSWFIITNADRFLMNRFFDAGAVGLYAVYMSTSMIIMGRGLSFFINVFFPTVAGISAIAAVNKKINKAFMVGAVPIVIGNTGIMYGMFLIYGAAYPFYFFWTILFSISALLYSLVHIKWSMIMTRSETALRRYAWVSLGGAVINFALSYFLIQSMGIVGAVLSALITYVYFLAVAEYYLKKEYWYGSDAHA